MELSKQDMELLPHSAPSWILSLAENLASSSLQDGATEWHYYDHIPPTQPPTHPKANVWKLCSYVHPGVGTPHRINKGKTSMVGGGGGVVWWDNIATPGLHLASWNLLDSQLSWVSKMEPCVAISHHMRIKEGGSAFHVPPLLKLACISSYHS